MERSLDLPLTNCEIELDFRRTRKCMISELSSTFRAVDSNANTAVYQVASETNSETFQRNNAKLDVPVFTLSINDNIKFLENIKQGFKKTVSWNKYRSEITTQPKTNDLVYLIDATFWNINRLSVISLKHGNNVPTRDSFHKYYMQLVEIKDFNVLIDNKPFFLINK